MLSLFLKVLNLSLVGSYIILIVLLARLLLQKSPKWCSYLLWGVVFLRLVLPVFPESEYSLIPEGLEISDYVIEDLQGKISSQQDVPTEGMQADDKQAYDIPTNSIQEETGRSGNLSANSMQEDKQTGDTQAQGTQTVPQHAGTLQQAGLQNSNTVNADVTVPDGKSQQELTEGTSEEKEVAGTAITENMTSEDMQAISDDALETAGNVLETAGDRNNAGKMSGIFRIFSYIWLVGMIALAVYHIWSYNRFRKQVRGAVLAEDGVYEIQGTHISFVMGIWKPAIYLSGELDAESRKVVLCHEQVHLKRRDYLIKPLALAVCCVHWFNPLVWLAFYLMGRDCEMSCDEKVVSILGEDSKKTYSFALLDEATGGKRAKSKRENMCAVLSFGEESIKSRIKHVLNYKRASVWLSGGTVLVLAVLIVCLCSNSKTENAENYTVSEIYFKEGSSSQEEHTDTFAENREHWMTESDITQKHNIPWRTLESWATAFQDKNGDMLHDLSYDQEAFLEWDMITVEEDGVSVGYASPWPTQYDYEIYYETGAEDATIRYWMRSSEPEVFPYEEQVKLIKEGDLYYVEHVSSTSYNEINTLQEFMEAYVPYDERGNATADLISSIVEPQYNWTTNTGYDKRHMRYIYDQVAAGTNPEYYDAYKNPVTAAKLMLHLGEGSGEPTQYLYKAEPQTMDILTGNRQMTDSPEEAGRTGENLTGDLQAADILLGEGSIVNVTYTFAEDGSSIQIPMVKVEETLGLWALSTGDLTGSESQTRGALPADQEFLARKIREEIEYAEGEVVQATDYGIYRLNKDGLVNMYSENMPVNVAYYYNPEEQMLYFPIDILYEEYSLEWTPEYICQMDVASGAYRYIYHEKAANIDDKHGFRVENGFITISGLIYQFYDAQAVWNGKTTAELSEAEKDEYGAYMREYILAHPGEMLEVSNRYDGWTEAIIDLDGDGHAEDITIEDINNVNYSIYDNYYIKSGDFSEERYASGLYNKIWAVSLDGEHICVALYEAGPSGDPKTTFFRYEKEALVEAGMIRQEIPGFDIVDGVIHTHERVWILQTDGIYVQYGMNASGNIEPVSQEFYEFTAQNDLTLKEDLTVYAEPDSTESFVISPQMVRLIRVTQDYKWVYLEAESGAAGWFEVESYGRLADGRNPDDVFDGLSHAG